MTRLIHKIICGNCIKVIREMEKESIDLVVTDPPYFKIMRTDYKGNKYSWDNQWESFEEYLKWCEVWLSDIYRVLKKNGSAYIFGDDKNIAYIQVMANKLKWCLINNIVWYKENNMPIKGWNRFRCFAPVTERILFYGKEDERQGESGVFNNLRKYLNEERLHAELSLKKMNEVLGVSTNGGGMACHYCSEGNKIWELPTKDAYKNLQTTGFFKKEYEELRKEYEELRRYFSADRNYTDVWKIPIVGGKEINTHPTQKPLRLIERIIRVSSKEGDTILSPFMGSGTDLVAAERLGRNSIGIEISKEYCEIAYQRLLNEVRQGKMDRETSVIERVGF